MTATLLLNQAYNLHYAKRFREACVAYRQLLRDFPSSHECDSARRQLVNLHDFDTGAAEVPDATRPYVNAAVAPVPRATDPVGQVQNRGDAQGEEGRR